MTYDPRHRDSSWKMYIPGCYVDPENNAHLFPDEFLAYLQAKHPEANFDPKSKRDYDIVAAVFMEMIRERYPDAKFSVIKHTREPQS